MTDIATAYDSVGGNVLLDRTHHMHRIGVLTDKEHALRCIAILRERLTRVDDWSGAEMPNN